MPFFWLILLFAVVTEFVTFGLWNLLQYLSNVTGFCCHTSGNLHQSCKILVLMKECDVNEQLIKIRMNSSSFSSLYSPCWDCDQISKDVLKPIAAVSLENQTNCSSWRGWAYMSSGACSAPHTELPWMQACRGSLCATSLPGHHAEQLFQNTIWFLSSAYIAAVCNP